jgi:hypothetical protein
LEEDHMVHAIDVLSLEKTTRRGAYRFDVWMWAGPGLSIEREGRRCGPEGKGGRGKRWATGKEGPGREG